MENLKKYNKIGIMGGTFDPIHNQHLYIANTALTRLDLDIILFIPTGKMPHKNNHFVTDKTHRFNMVSLAIADNEKFFISDIETNSEIVNYTSSTLEKIKKQCNENVQLFFIIGIDSLYDLNTWKNPNIISNICTIVSFNRPNYSQSKENKELIEKYNFKIKMIDDISVSLSSTDIRNKIMNNESCKYLIPDNVLEYIEKHKLFSYKFDEEYIENLKIEVSKKISKKRFTHTLGVMNVAIKLAKTYGENTNNCIVASLLHDYAKEMSKEDKFRYLNKYNLYLDEYTKNNIDLSHGLIASHIAKNIFNIKNKDVINAIEFHTTGRPNMSLLEKIIYLSDSLDPNRNYKNLEHLTNLAFKNIDKALLECIAGKIDFTLKKGESAHPISIVTLDYYKKIYEENKNV